MNEIYVKIQESVKELCEILNKKFPGIDFKNFTYDDCFNQKVLFPSVMEMALYIEFIKFGIIHD